MTIFLVSLLFSAAPVAAAPSCASQLTVARAIETIGATAREFAVADSNHDPTRWRARTGANGLPALDLPTEDGGSALGAVDMARIFAAAGRVALDLRDVVGAGHARVLVGAPHPAVRDIVRAVARGEAYVAIAITEEHAGSDVRAMTSQAEPVPGGFALTGAKLFNARLSRATHVIIFTQSVDAPGRLSTFVVPRDHPGLVIESLDAHGLHGNSFGGVKFARMFVPGHLAIAPDAGGGAKFREHFAYWRLMMAAAAIGTGEGALTQVVERLRGREVFGGPIGRFTHLQQPLAEHTAKLRMARLLVAEAAGALDRGDQREAAPLVAMAKAEGVEFALAAADFAMKTFGAEGYSTRVDLGRRVVDLMGLRIADGTTDVMRAEVVRHTYGDEFWDMAIGERPSPAPAPPPADVAPRMMVGAPLVMMGAHAPAAGAAAVTPKYKWATQADFDPLIRPGGGGACATVTAFNLAQRLRASALGLTDLDPHAVIGDVVLRLPELLDGRVTNAQFERVLRALVRDHVPGSAIDVTAHDGRAAVVRPIPNHHQVLAYLVFTKDGRFVGRHFVVVTDRAADLVAVQDPRDPRVEVSYRVATAEDGRQWLHTLDGARAYALDAVIDVRTDASGTGE